MDGPGVNCDPLVRFSTGLTVINLTIKEMYGSHDVLKCNLATDHAWAKSCGVHGPLRLSPTTIQCMIVPIVVTPLAVSLVVSLFPLAVNRWLWTTPVSSAEQWASPARRGLIASGGHGDRCRRYLLHAQFGSNASGSSPFVRPLRCSATVLKLRISPVMAQGSAWSWAMSWRSSRRARQAGVDLHPGLAPGAVMTSRWP